MTALAASSSEIDDDDRHPGAEESLEPLEVVGEARDEPHDRVLQVGAAEQRPVQSRRLTTAGGEHAVAGLLGGDHVPRAELLDRHDDLDGGVDGQHVDAGVGAGHDRDRLREPGRRVHRHHVGAHRKRRQRDDREADDREPR